MFSRLFLSNFRKAFADFRNSFLCWRIFGIIGVNDIQKRYARSKLGQFWLTISLAVHIATLGFVWAYLFKLQVKEYLPFISTSIIIWHFILGCITEGTNVFITCTSYLKELNIPKICYINSVFVRNKIILFHNLLVLVPIYWFCSIYVSFKSLLLFICAFTLLCLFLFPVMLVLGIIALRFRDIPNMIVSLMQIVFYLTPVMWKTNLMPERFHQYLILNPFAVFIELCTNPLLGNQTLTEYWIASIFYILAGFAVALPMFSKYRSKITYWL